MATPHRVVDSIANGIANGAEGLINAGANALKDAGHAIMSGLDKPFTAVTKREGPHHIIGRAADGAVETVQRGVDEGIIGSAKRAGEGIMSALDHPPEQVGLPPDLEGDFLRKGGR